jgi:hypothetical protein
VDVDSKEGNVKFQFSHEKCIEHFPRNNILFKGTSVLMKLSHHKEIRYEAQLYGFKENALWEAARYFSFDYVFFALAREYLF